ncbi:MULTISPECIES: Holliday junction branch migration protein RuvA [Halorhodospira]|uniref:Holliday junction branch migration protein RuvA n=1 Tax=Halorhodospira TaxID=85108 RepID=UPI001912F308|nr:MULTISPECIES: Holliday junction branch migration protein RuvA [Halorhodospira]MBK5937674.1 Holliday junction branch migration protein RuvA [Halorhodospira halophila]MCG5527357.1 Holliday junction branch migration protein RuvA [Halorhodospira halophila]MCG5532923.1 Holliday junction branch migration protein RuvA [Halorhodospira sp. 9621]MCG5539113.1 Holliday junction branch migration protein RuvA [Halorhodospira sp. 9622]MCG5541753.1 Holliday junction branch migration protein RuvA [Halorhodo
MIARLRGTLLEKRPPTLVVEVNGLGYEVEAPLSTIEALPETGQEVILHTHLSVREDGQTLFGFRARAERDLFRRLIRVSGVGPKLGLALLSGVDGEELVRCVRDDDPKRLTQVPGIGRKTAERLIVELRDRLEGIASGGAGTATQQADQPAGGDDPVGEAVEGLVALGYKPPEASRMARGAAEPGLGCEAIIRRALQRAVPRGG